MTTGIDDAMTAAGIPSTLSLIPLGYRPLTSGTGYDPDLLTGSDCMCVVEKLADAITGEVVCQAICQRAATPSYVDLTVLLKGTGTFDWANDNSGFSVDKGTTWYELLPKTTGEDSMASDTSGLEVDGQLPFNMVLDMDEHIDDFLNQTGIDYLLTFTVS